MHNLKKKLTIKLLKSKTRQLNAPYTCRTKDKILEIGKRMKFYKKKKNERKEEKNSCTERQMSWNMTSDNKIHKPL